MSKTIRSFEIYENPEIGTIRELIFTDNSVWYVVNDIAKILGYTRAGITSKLKDVKKEYAVIPNVGREMLIVDRETFKQILSSTKLTRAKTNKITAWLRSKTHFIEDVKRKEPAIKKAPDVSPDNDTAVASSDSLKDSAIVNDEDDKKNNVPHITPVNIQPVNAADIPADAEDAFIDEYLPFADDSTRVFVKSMLLTIRSLNSTISQGKKTISLLNHEKEVLAKANKILALEPDDNADKSLILSLLKRFSVSATNGDMIEAWDSYKRELVYSYGINIDERRKNHINNKGYSSKITLIDMITDSEIPAALSCILCMCRKNGVYTDDLLGAAA